MSQTPTKDQGSVEPIVVLRAFVASHGTQKQAAEALGVSGVFVCDMLKGRRDISAKVLAKLGLRRVVVPIPAPPVDATGVK